MPQIAKYVRMYVATCLCKYLFTYVCIYYRRTESSYWKPGEVLPMSSPDQSYDEVYAPESPVLESTEPSSVVDLLKAFQADISVAEMRSSKSLNPTRELDYTTITEL